MLGKGGIAGQTTKTVPAIGAELGESGWMGDNKADRICKRCYEQLKRTELSRHLQRVLGLLCFHNFILQALAGEVTETKLSRFEGM